MRAARFVGPGAPVELVELPDPAPGAADVVVRVEACGICASDLHFLDGEVPLPAPPPLTLGHEASGVIAEVGADVPVWRNGDRVSVMGGKVCLACDRCAAGRLDECRDPRIMGAHYDGAWAGFVSVPWYAVAALPDEVSFDHGAIACDAVATPYAALAQRGALRAGERVGVWGVGGLGTHAVQIARVMGASFVGAIDPLPAARERALAVGADAAFDPADDVPNLIRDATGGRKLDLALDCIGRTAAVRQAMFSLARGGRVVLVGQSFESLDAGPILGLSVLRISLLGHLGYGKRDLEDVLGLIASGRLDLSASISDRLPLEGVNEGIDRLRRKDEGTVRLILLPQT